MTAKGALMAQLPFDGRYANPIDEARRLRMNRSGCRIDREAGRGRGWVQGSGGLYCQQARRKRREV